MSSVLIYIYVDGRLFSEWRSQTLARLTQIFGGRHTYTASFGSLGDRATVDNVYRGLGVLQAALEDVEKGHLDTLQEMAAAEVFPTFLIRLTICVSRVTGLPPQPSLVRS